MSAPIFVLAFLALPAVHAGPREDFKAAVAAVQQSPGDAALREKVIALAKMLKPAPAVPESARRALVRGATFQREAKDDAAYAKAEAAFRQATDLAPWWSDAYFNLSVVQEARKDLAGSAASLKLFLLAAPEAERRDGQDRLYALEAKAELAQEEADARFIRPGASVGPLRLGMSEQALVQAAGEPTEASRTTFSNNMQWAGRYHAEISSGRASLIRTESDALRTPQGLGVGSTRAEVVRAMGEPDEVVEEPSARYLCYKRGIMFRYPASERKMDLVAVFPPSDYQNRCE
jgi:hypothetical protein